jgi:hypothetical protein
MYFQASYLVAFACGIVIGLLAMVALSVFDIADS